MESSTSSVYFISLLLCFSFIILRSFRSAPIHVNCPPPPRRPLQATRAANPSAATSNPSLPTTSLPKGLPLEILVGPEEGSAGVFPLRCGSHAGGEIPGEAATDVRTWAWCSGLRGGGVRPKQQQQAGRGATSSYDSSRLEGCGGRLAHSGQLTAASGHDDAI
jgi:hypothetical protein